jgi:hypothetical protein
MVNFEQKVVEQPNIVWLKVSGTGCNGGVHAQ